MKASGSADVIILGGGACGLWAAYLLAEKFDCILIDQNPIAAYASTRNQGFIHSGAMYVGYDDPDAANDCQAGQKDIVDFDTAQSKTAIHKANSIYLSVAGSGTSARQEMKKLLTGCSERPRKIKCDPLDFNEARRVEPLISDEKFSFAAKAGDLVIDTTSFLGQLATQAQKKGVRFHQFDGEVTSVSFEKISERFRVWKDGDFSFESQFLILCCGAAMPEVVGKNLQINCEGWLESWRILVLVIHEPISKSLLVVTPRKEGAPTISPFYRNGIQLGVTVCSVQRETKRKERPDFSVESTIALNDLFSYYPSLLNRNRIFPVHFYECEKLERPNSKSKRGHWIISDTDPKLNAWKNLFLIYPGKFTAASLAARDLTNEIASRSEKLLRAKKDGRSELTVNVAVQPYFGTYTHSLSIQDKKWNLIEISKQGP